MTGDELRALRQRLGLTQVQLAAALGMSASMIAKYEAQANSNREPIPRVVEMAVRALADRHDRENGRTQMMTIYPLILRLAQEAFRRRCEEVGEEQALAELDASFARSLDAIDKLTDATVSPQNGERK